MRNNINIDTNNSQIYASGTKNSLIQKTQVQKANSEIKLAAKASEDKLVEFSEYADQNIDTQDEISVIIQEYTKEMNKYFRYQTKLMELQRQYNEIQRQISNSDNNNEKTRLQGKLSGFDTQISALKNNLQACSNTLNDINAQLHASMCSTITNNSVQMMKINVQPAKTTDMKFTGATAMAATQSTQSIGRNIAAQNIQYIGNTIPKKLAVRLDEKLGSGFSQKCEQVAAKIGCSANDLLAMMYSESGLNTTARNKNSNAVGLIQFIPSTLSGNGYSTEQVASMNAVQQLDVVADIFMKAKKMAGYEANEKIDGGTLYAVNWLPAYAKRDTIVSKGEKYYSNGLDTNKDGSVTKNDLAQRLQSKYNEMLRAIYTQ